MINRIHGEQKGITGLETAIILIAFVVVASVFSYTVLSAGLFTTEKSKEAVFGGLQEIQGTMEIRGDVIAHKDTLNGSGSGSIGKIDITVIECMSGGQIDLTSAYTINPGTGALTNSNPGANRLQIAFHDKDISIGDCPWTVEFIGKNNGDNILDSDEKAVLTVWLHAFNGTVWGPAESEGTCFIGTDYVDTYHSFNLEIKAVKGAILALERTTPAFLDNVVDLH